MKPITFACQQSLSLAPDEIAQQILDVAKWPAFRGYGPISGIKAADFEVRTPHIVGSRIQVTNLDGSTHLEEIVEWRPDQRLRLRMEGFTAPLSRLATDFVETWEFQRQGNETKVTRSFELNAKSTVTWPILWLISYFLKAAIARHMRELRTKS